MIVPPNNDAGNLSPRDESQLNLGVVPKEKQIGFMARKSGTMAARLLMGVITRCRKCLSTETGQPVAAIVVGFNPIELSAERLKDHERYLAEGGQFAFAAALGKSSHAADGDELTRNNGAS